MYNEIGELVKTMLDNSKALYQWLQMILFKVRFFPRLTWLTALLWPLSCMRYLHWQTQYYLRKRLPQRNNLKLSIPIIHIESIVADKDKRTALFIMLAQILKGSGQHPGVLMYDNHATQGSSRHWVTKEDVAKAVGRAALSIVKKAQVPVLLSKEYTQAICKLFKDESVDIILSNYETHKTSQRDIKVIVVDADLWFGNQCLLPAGPLEKPLAYLRTADLILVDVPYALGQGTIDGETNFATIYQDKISFLKIYAPDCLIGFMQMVPQGFTHLRNKSHLAPHAFERTVASVVSTSLIQLRRLASSLEALGIHLKDMGGPVKSDASLFFIDEQDALEYEINSPQNNLWILESSMQLEKENNRCVVLDELCQKIEQANA